MHRLLHADVLTFSKAVIKTLRLGLPDNIEHIPADWAKVEKAVAEQLVQARSLIKRAVSTLVNDSLVAPLIVHTYPVPRSRQASKGKLPPTIRIYIS